MKCKSALSRKQEHNQRIKELASENAALREQRATEESSWEQEKEKIVKALQSVRARQMETKMKVNEEKRSNEASQKLIEVSKHILERVKQGGREKDAKEIKLTFDTTLMSLNAERDSDFVRQEEEAAELHLCRRTLTGRSSCKG